MINSVRQTVMSVLNKNNYGYISPSDFNLFAKQAQLDLFETYFYSYNYQIQKENARQSGTGYADITKGLEEVIDTFSVTLPLLNNGGNNEYFLPSLTTTNNDYYLINKNLVYNKELAEGTTTATNGGGVGVFDATADFITLERWRYCLNGYKWCYIQYCSHFDIKCNTTDSCSNTGITSLECNWKDLQYLFSR